MSKECHLERSELNGTLLKLGLSYPPTSVNHKDEDSAFIISVLKFLIFVCGDVMEKVPLYI